MKSFQRTIAFFSLHGHPIPHIIPDNESPTLLTQFFQSLPVPPKVQFVPPNNHRANPAERSIRTFKNHFISLLASVHIHFPPDLWDLPLPHAELTLNHLRPWHPDPLRSAYSGLHGAPVDFLSHPLHPFGQLVVAHDSPGNRPSWAPHGQRGFYLGTSLPHYRCSSVYIVHTGATRTCDTLDHFPNPLFHFEQLPGTPLTSPLPPSRPEPAAGGSDLVGRWFNDPDLGLYQITARGGVLPPPSWCW